jgi:vacuolar-type H+-ATPase subunit I/STV1
VQDIELLSKVVANKRKLPGHVRGELSQLQVRFRTVVERVAVEIETRKYADLELALNSLDLPAADFQYARELVEADKEVHIDYQSLSTTIELFAELNQVILNRLKEPASKRAETQLVLANALIVYELTDFVITRIESFLKSKDSRLESIYDRTKSRLASLKKQQRELRRMTDKLPSGDSVKHRTLQDIDMRDEAIRHVEAEWARYMDEIASMRASMRSVKENLPQLEVIRKNAKIQIGVIREVAILDQLMRNIVFTISPSIEKLNKLKLAPLTGDRIRRMLSMPE